MVNAWFVPENTRKALLAISQAMLDRVALQEWASHYSISAIPHPNRTIGLVMAGNIPLVGFHDWLSVFVAGHRALVKCSDKDALLLPFLLKKLGEWDHRALAYTHFLLESERMQGIDAVIATGSNNTARYFEQYFGKYPHIIRRNRNGIAVLDGSETAAELTALGSDIFAYFGLGCRNVSKLYVPQDYDFEPLLEALMPFQDIVLHNKYKNNFDYNFTLLILNKIPHRSNGCTLLVEDDSLHARIAMLHYSYYHSIEALASDLSDRQSEVQVVVSKHPIPGFSTTAFGSSQQPGLMDYPDGVDVMTFLTQPGFGG